MKFVNSIHSYYSYYFIIISIILCLIYKFKKNGSHVFI